MVSNLASLEKQREEILKKIEAEKASIDKQKAVIAAEKNKLEGFEKSLKEFK